RGADRAPALAADDGARRAGGGARHDRGHRRRDRGRREAGRRRARGRPRPPPGDGDGRLYGDRDPERVDRRRHRGVAGRGPARGGRTRARSAVLTDVVEPEVYGRAYGFERAMDNAGAIAGPLLALGLIAVVGVREAILLSVVPGLLAALAIFIAVRSARRLERHERSPLRIRIRPVLHGRLGRLLGAVTAFELGNVAATLLILRATDLLTPDRGHDSAVRL